MIEELLFSASVAKLKEYALELKKQYDKAGWFKRRSIRNRLMEVLDEIEYQEGRLQYANRPYSFPSLRRCTGDPMRCSCGCWRDVRDRFLNL
jgi:hypothetical protein